MKELFLNCNAHQNVNQEALQAYIHFNNSTGGHGHPLAPDLAGRAAQRVLEEARQKIADLIGAQKASQIIFTSGCTQSCEWAAVIMSRLNLSSYLMSEILISPIEHNAVVDAINTHCKNYSIKRLPVSSDGVIPLDSITYAPEAFICVHMQNEIGTIQPIKELKSKYNKFVFSDMSQSLGKMPIDVTDLNIDIATFSAHKFGGIGGVGFLYLKDTSLWQEYFTGSRYYLDQTGTPNTAGIVASAVALEEAVNSLSVRTEKMIDFRDELELGLKQLGYEIIGEKAERCPNTTFVKVGSDGEGARLLHKLGEEGIYVGMGSACGSIVSGPNKTLKSLGKESSGNNYIRISQWGEYDKIDARNFLDKLKNNL